MLEIKNLSKIYKPKKGVPVTALKDINLKLPDKGMVFLLGKSGSGKSTLLNLLGGLDRYDSGEIIINGVSSKDFKQSHFDSYRNTYVGFIFQEYNILDEFNVGENIAIALKLQGKKVTDDIINDILGQVDLAGYGNRKPNELSGGQKQRVAIARALVKYPEIIMADEPSGALDSNTGRQVFDTLKKLSGEKLVIVVSHDREFAENYADRIIELADGSIINDITVDSDDNSASPKETLAFEENTVIVKGGYHLTEDDLNKINEYIDSLKSGDLKLTVKEKGVNRKFKKTDCENISVDKAKKFSLIKSKLPMKSAFKMGAGGLKHKKFRLVITILLSCVAFGLFGLADTFGAYNHIKVCTNSIYDTGIDYASVAKAEKLGDGWYENGQRLSDKDLADIKNNTGVTLNGVFIPKGSNLSFADNNNPEIKTTESQFEIYNSYFSGFAEIGEKTLGELGYKLVAGRYPDGAKDEIAVSKYVFDVFAKKQYTDGVPVKDANGKEELKYQDIREYGDLLEKVITVNNKKYTVVGIVDTKLDLSRYEGLIENKDNQSDAQMLVDYALNSEFQTHLNSSLDSVIMVGEGKLETLIAQEPPIFNITKGYLWFYGDYNIDPSYITTLDKIDPTGIIWVGEPKTQLAEKDIIVFESDLIFDDGEENSAVVYKDDGSVDIAKTLAKQCSVKLNARLFAEEDFIEEDGYKIVGVIPNIDKYKQFASVTVVSKSLFNDYATDDGGKYSLAVGNMPSEKADIKTLVAYCYNEDTNIKYPLQNSVTYELDMVNSELKEFAKIFLYIGLGFALFAAVMLANFISTSISYKKQEIGILRAIGSRSNDVFRIFFSESFIIAMINFVLSAIGVFAVTQVINAVIRKNAGVLITLLTFGPRQIILLLFVSVFIAFVASFIPVYKIASKKPIDAIRDR